MDVEAQGHTTLSCFPWLLPYRNGELPERWRHERDAILASDTRLSETRVGMLARAKIFVLVLDECAAFEGYMLAQSTPGQSADLSEEEAALYTWLVEQSATPRPKAGAFGKHAPKLTSPLSAWQEGAVRKERIGTGKCLFQLAALRSCIKQRDGVQNAVCKTYETLP